MDYHNKVQVYYIRDHDGAKLVRVKYDSGKMKLTDGFNADYITQEKEDWFANCLKDVLEELYDTAYERGKMEVREKLKDAFEGVFSYAFEEFK
jgi:hypothetical protein